jgi:hypothetical protein
MQIRSPKPYHSSYLLNNNFHMAESKVNVIVNGASKLCLFRNSPNMNNIFFGKAFISNFKKSIGNHRSINEPTTSMHRN